MHVIRSSCTSPTACVDGLLYKYPWDTCIPSFSHVLPSFQADVDRIAPVLMLLVSKVITAFLPLDCFLPPLFLPLGREDTP